MWRDKVSFTEQEKKLQPTCSIGAMNLFGGKKEKCPFLIKGRVQRSPQGFYYGVVASLGGQLFPFHFVKIDIWALDLKWIMNQWRCEWVETPISLTGNRKERRSRHIHCVFNAMKDFHRLPLVLSAVGFHTYKQRLKAPRHKPTATCLYPTTLLPLVWPVWQKS